MHRRKSTSYRMGRFGRFELSRYEGPDVAPPPPLRIDNPKDHGNGRSEPESLNHRSVDGDDSLQLSRSSMESESDNEHQLCLSRTLDQNRYETSSDPHPSRKVGRTGSRVLHA